MTVMVNGVILILSKVWYDSDISVTDDYKY